MSDIEPKKLKVAELRDLLRDRGLDTKGNKAALVKRLEKAIKEEAVSHPEDSESGEEDGPEDSSQELDTSCDDSMLNKTAESDAPEGQEDDEPEPIPVAASPEPEPVKVASPERAVIHQPSPSPSPEPIQEVEEPEDVQQIESSPEPMAADEPEDQQMSEPEAIEADQAAPVLQKEQQAESESEEEDLPQQQPEDEQMSGPEENSESESEPEPEQQPAEKKPEPVQQVQTQDEEEKMEVEKAVESKPEPEVEQEPKPVDGVKAEVDVEMKSEPVKEENDQKPEEDSAAKADDKKEEVKDEEMNDKKEEKTESEVNQEQQEKDDIDDEVMEDRNDDDKHGARKRRHGDGWDRGDYHGNREGRDHDHFRSHSPQHRVPEPEENEDWLQSTDFLLDKYNSDLNLRVADDGFKANPITVEGFGFMWAGARANYGVNKGKVWYEVQLVEHLNVDHLPPEESSRHVVRIGWSTDDTTTQLGEEKHSWGYGGTGKASTECKFTDFGEKFGENDVIGCYLDMDSEPMTISYTKNGEDLGTCFEIEKSTLEEKALFPHVLTKNTEFTVNFGQKETPHHEAKEGFILMNAVPAEDRVRGAVPPEKKEECEIIMMCGLPGCGKTTWANKTMQAHPEKKYVILGTNNIIDKMKVMGLPRKKNYSGRWDILIDKANRCLSRMMEIGSKKKRNYILDQTNVYPSAQRRKMRPFEGFQRKAIVIVPTEEEFKKRCELQEKEEGKDVPESAVNEMKANFRLPEVGQSFDEVTYIELPEEEAKTLVEQYNQEGQAALPPPDKRFRGGRDRGGGRDFRGGSGRFEPYNRDNRGMGRWGGGGGDRGGYRDGGYRDRNQYNRYDDRGSRDRYGQRGGGSGDRRGGRGGWDRSGGGGYNDRRGGYNDRNRYQGGGGYNRDNSGGYGGRQSHWNQNQGGWNKNQGHQGGGGGGGGSWGGSNNQQGGWGNQQSGWGNQQSGWGNQGWGNQGWGNQQQQQQWNQQWANYYANQNYNQNSSNTSNSTTAQSAAATAARSAAASTNSNTSSQSYNWNQTATTQANSTNANQWANYQSQTHPGWGWNWQSGQWQYTGTGTTAATTNTTQSAQNQWYGQNYNYNQGTGGQAQTTTSQSTTSSRSSSK